MARKHQEREPSDLRLDYDYLKQLAVENRDTHEPGRREYVMAALRERGFSPVWNEEKKAVMFDYKGNTITVWPYKGFFSGKGVKDGRGVRKLLNQLDR